MSRSGNAGAYLLGLAIIAITAVLSWLLFVSPTLEERSELLFKAQEQRELNDRFAQQVARLKADYERLPIYLAEMHEIQGDLPAIEDAPAVLRTLDETLSAQSLTVVMGYRQAAPFEVGNVINLTGAYAEVGKVSYVESLEFAGLIATPFELELLGPQIEILSFVHDLQHGEHRFVLVETIDFQLVDPAEAAGPRPEIGDFWWEGTVHGFFFTLRQDGIDPRELPGPDGTYPLWSTD